MPALLLYRCCETLDLARLDGEDHVFLLAADRLHGRPDLLGEPDALGSDSGEGAQSLGYVAHVHQAISGNASRENAEQRDGKPDLRDNPDSTQRTTVPYGRDFNRRRSHVQVLQPIATQPAIREGNKLTLGKSRN